MKGVRGVEGWRGGGGVKGLKDFGITCFSGGGGREGDQLSLTEKVL